jgi:hypothetical protein
MRLIKSRIHYWSCSKFANWIRGENKPVALEWGEWDEWYDEQKQKRPFRYWLSDTFLKRLQDIVYFPLDLYRTIAVYIRNRYIDKLQYLHTGLKPGEYYDLDYRIIHALFNELVDFVEKDLSHLSRWDRNKTYKFKNGRCIEAAYDYFKWANNLKRGGKLTEQAKASRKIQKLYEWWKNKRPNRVDPFSFSQFSYDIDDILDGKQIKEKQKDLKKAYDLELSQENEDTEMLVELIKVRNHLWT